MAQNAANVHSVKPQTAGAVWVAPAGTSLPTDAATALANTFSGFGYLSEDGIKRSINKTVDDKKAFGGDIVLSTTTEFGMEYTFKPIELNETTAKAMFGSSNVIVSSGSITGIKMKNEELPSQVMVFELIKDDAKKMRVVLPDAKITTIGENNYKDGELLASEIVVKARPDGTGVYAYVYFATA